MTTLIVAAPLMARSGVYRSTLDLVATARAAGEDWRAVIAVRPMAGGTGSAAPGISETTITEHGRQLLPALRDLVEPHLLGVDTIVTMVPQSDIVVSRMAGRPRHVAWIRGLPWPGAGEQSPLRSAVLRRLETAALRRADDVWATSPLLAAQVSRAVTAAVVPAGVPLLARSHHGATAGPLRWAGRLSAEKGPAEFLGIVRRTGLDAEVYGEGPLLEQLRSDAPGSVSWHGWAHPDAIWERGGIALCTSHRDAFGRSPVEAASAGLPLVLSDQTGVAPFLYTDPELAERFILPVDAHARWDDAVLALHHDEGLRRRVSDHVHRSAQRLSIQASFGAALSHLT